MKDTEFVSMAIGLGEVLGDIPSEPRIVGLWEILKGFPDAELKKAFNQAARTLRFFPKPCEIIEIIEGGQDERLELEALEAFRLVTDVMHKDGGYGSVSFPDPVNAIIQGMGGWLEITKVTSENWQNYKKREFVKEYVSRTKTGQTSGPAQLCGMFREKEVKYFGFLGKPKTTPIAENN